MTKTGSMGGGPSARPPAATEPPVFDLVRLTEADLPAVLALERLCYDQPWTAENFLGEFRRHITLPLGLKRGGDLAGYCFFWLFSQQIHLLNLAVRPEYRRLGLARRLLSAMFTIGRRARAEEAFLEVRPSNGAAVALYRSFGFQDGRLRPDYYDDGEDALTMNAFLVAKP